jgi:hypothetical protein
MSKVAKYGKFVHLEQLLQGTFRAAVASIYKDSKLTAAQQDDENRKSSLMPPTTRIGIPSPTGMHYGHTDNGNPPRVLYDGFYFLC